MNEKDTIMLEKAEKLIDEGKYRESLDLLKVLAPIYPKEGRIAYNLGRVSMVDGDPLITYKFLKQAIKLDYESAHLYLLLGETTSVLENAKEARGYFEKAVELAGDEMEKWASFSGLAEFYIKNKMFLNAEKIAKDLIKEYPDNYQGYHYMFTIYALKELYDTAEKYLESISDVFSRTTQFQMDKLDLYNVQGKIDEYLKFAEMDENIMEVIPSTVLKHKFHKMYREKDNECKDVLKDVLLKYPDKDSMVAAMILLFASQKYEDCSAVAVALGEMNNLTKMDMYLVLYFQIFCLYMQSDGKPSEKLLNWIEQAGGWCVGFASSIDKNAGAQVRDSLQQLIEKIKNDSDAV